MSGVKSAHPQVLPRTGPSSEPRTLKAGGLGGQREAMAEFGGGCGRGRRQSAGEAWRTLGSREGEGPVEIWGPLAEEEEGERRCSV